jgi:molybdate transport system regulatory protein
MPEQGPIWHRPMRRRKRRSAAGSCLRSTLRSCSQPQDLLRRGAASGGDARAPCSGKLLRRLSKAAICGRCRPKAVARQSLNRPPTSQMHPRLRLVVNDEVAIGPGKAELLELIALTGSIAAAGRAMGMSCKRAWLLVETMNRCFRGPLVTASRGGRDKGGARLTDAGRLVLSCYRRLLWRIDTGTDLEIIRGLVRSRSTAWPYSNLRPASFPERARGSWRNTSTPDACTDPLVGSTVASRDRNSLSSIRPNGLQS